MSGPGRDSEMSTSGSDALIKDLTVLINHTHLGPSAGRNLEKIVKKKKKKKVISCAKRSLNCL